eukprot:1153583-Pelagomonas_calceolata.AAC.3
MGMPIAQHKLASAVDHGQASSLPSGQTTWLKIKSHCHLVSLTPSGVGQYLTPINAAFWGADVKRKEKLRRQGKLSLKINDSHQLPPPQSRNTRG